MKTIERGLGERANVEYYCRLLLHGFILLVLTGLNAKIRLSVIHFRTSGVKLVYVYLAPRSREHSIACNGPIDLRTTIVSKPQLGHSLVYKLEL